MLKFNLSLIAIVSAALVGCIEAPQEDLSSAKFNQLTVNQNFDWKTTQTFDLNVSVLESKSYTLKSKITVYNGDPNRDGEIIATGSASAGKAFSTKMSVPSAVKELFIKYESPYGKSELIATPINGSKVDYTFGSAAAKSSFMNAKSAQVVAPSCESCKNVISGSGSVAITKGETYCVTSSFNGSIDMQSWSGGGTLQVCGSATINKLSLGDNCHIVVLEGGKLEIENLDIWGKNSMVKVYGSGALTLKNTLTTKGYLYNAGTISGTNLNLQDLTETFVNYGTLSFTGKVQLNQTTKVENHGAINVGSSFELNSTSLLNNYGSVSVPNSTMQVNQKAQLYNYGPITVGGSIEFNSELTSINYCKIQSGKNITINNGDVAIKQGFMVSVSDFTVNNAKKLALVDIAMVQANRVVLNSGASISGEGSTSVVSTNTFTVNGKETVTGNVEVNAEKFIYYTNSIDNHLLDGAYYTAIGEAKAFIPKSECNSAGFGKVDISDSDLDGVEDDMDEFPSNPNLAYTSYFPAKGSNGTVAFEDLWPSQGDYDFNDMVIDFSGEMLVNADNMVSEMTLVFEIQAIGAAMDNGFAFTFDNLPAEYIKYAEGAVLSKDLFKLNENGTEVEQKQAVFAVFDSPEKLIKRDGAYFNTENDRMRSKAEPVKLHIIFSEPVSTDIINVENFNPFMVVNQKRTVEIHLPDFAPTLLADQSLLGTGDDASVAEKGLTYKSTKGLPWGILIFEPFDYPVERAMITDAHLFMAEWAVSGGKLYTDWYRDLKGYRNYDRIFKK